MSYIQRIARLFLWLIIFTTTVACCTRVVPQIPAETVKAVEPDKATVFIKQNLYLGDEDSEMMLEYFGTGFGIMHRNGKTYLLTAGHVCVGWWDQDISQRSVFVIIDRYENHYNAVVHRIDEKYDICLMSVPEALPITKLSEEEPQPGDIIHYSGYPLGIYIKNGINYFDGRMAGSSMDNNHLYNVPTVSGASGSPVYNDDGEVIGLISAVMVDFEHMTLGMGRQNIINFIDNAFEDPE